MQSYFVIHARGLMKCDKPRTASPLLHVGLLVSEVGKKVQEICAYFIDVSHHSYRSRIMSIFPGNRGYAKSTAGSRDGRKKTKMYKRHVEVPRHPYRQLRGGDAAAQEGNTSRLTILRRRGPSSSVACRQRALREKGWP